MSTLPIINTPPPTPVHESTKPADHHPPFIKPSPSSPIATPPIVSAPTESESPSLFPGKNTIELSLSTMEYQGNISPLSHTSYFLSKNFFDGEIAKKGDRFYILAKGPEWVDTSLLDLKEGYQSTREEPVSPDLTLALGKPIYGESSISEIRPLNIAELEENVQKDDDEEDSKPLSWRIKRPIVHSEPISTRDQVRHDKEKGRMVKGRAMWWSKVIQPGVLKIAVRWCYESQQTKTHFKEEIMKKYYY